MAVRPSWRALQILTLLSILLCVGVVYVATWGSVDGIGKYLPISIPSAWGVGDGGGAGDSGENGTGGNGGHTGEEMVKGHPIEHLMNAAGEHFEAMLKEEASSLEDAAHKYRAHRGRHPPPGFDAWYAYATENGAMVVESFFDQIYDDLGPFWGVDPRSLRQIAHTFTRKIYIREGEVDAESKNSYERLRGVLDMVQSLMKHPQVKLPDMDLPVNVGEEIAMLVPWENVDTAVGMARPILASPEDVLDEFTALHEDEFRNFKFDPEWLDGRLMHPSSNWLGPRPIWSLIQSACAPDSPARAYPLLEDIWHAQGHTSEEHTPAALLPLETPVHSLQGYVKNWTIATDACQFPNLQGLHGAFVAPQDMLITQKLFPLLSASKMSTSNEILIPSVGDWNISDYAPSPPPWSERKTELFWRRPASGGKNSAQNWQRFHRHRFVAMLNATHVEIAEGLLHAGNESMIGLGYARNFRLLPANEYKLEVQREGRMADWVSGWADAAFTDLRCEEGPRSGICPYVDEYFELLPEADAGEDAKYKFAAVVDADGGDDRGAFLTALRAGEVTLRASVYRQWYDSRVVPWLHFVPMDNMFTDMYGVMEFFLGSGVGKGAKEYAHAHVELPKHEHHFKTPHWDEEEEESAGHDHKHGEPKEHEEPHDREHAPEGIIKRSQYDDNGHDREAKKIAEAGKAWAEKVLRKEDMLIFVYRLLLEYARIVDDSRERLGWVGDLVSEGS